RHPDRVTALVLTAGFATPNPRFRLAVRLWRDLLASGDTARLAAFLTLTGFGAPALDAFGQADLDVAVKATALMVPPGTADHLALVDTVDVRPDLPGITVPTLVISTLHDALVTPAHHHVLARAIPDARLCELPTGHLPFLESPEQWLTRIRDFLAEATA
ncbi:alpha/beta hydrolase, partial [Streptomyces sp. URMC 129]|uniref:alpha/beta hydrolase n=1 Tax=Streptomyces sp. URMC 129 TaxID=3423407 RepID=UPI003F1B2975